MQNLMRDDGSNIAFVVVSDLHLDDPNVRCLTRTRTAPHHSLTAWLLTLPSYRTRVCVYEQSMAELARVFGGFEHAADETVFVLIGNFMSRPFGQGAWSRRGAVLGGPRAPAGRSGCRLTRVLVRGVLVHSFGRPPDVHATLARAGGPHWLLPEPRRLRSLRHCARPRRPRFQRRAASSTGAWG